VVTRALMALALVTVVSRPARADDAAADPLLLHAQELEDSGRGLRLEGILATVAGAGMLATSLVLFLDSGCVDQATSADAALDCSGKRWILLSLGLPTTVFGMTLWWVGQAEINQAQRLRGFVAPTRGGMVGGVRLLTF
jgi:hypothetical protein